VSAAINEGSGGMGRHYLPWALFALCSIVAAPVRAELSAEELAKIAQNPVGNLISVPFQYNANLNFGPEKKTQDVLNIQPVVPFEVSKDWNIITRTIMPIIWQPALGPGDSSARGLGDIQFSAFLSPASPGEWIWGLGAIAQGPSHTNSKLGNDHWGAGPTAVILHLSKGDPWVYGVLVNNIWSFGSGSGDPSYNNGLVQPFLNYNFPDATYLTSSPIITINWKAEGSQRFTVPIGGGIGHIFHFGKLPVNMQVAAYYNIAKPDFGANWQLRAQVQLMFPK
jgi:hypothetical protein